MDHIGKSRWRIEREAEKRAERVRSILFLIVLIAAFMFAAHYDAQLLEAGLIH